jgi:PAS domain-containing protein
MIGNEAQLKRSEFYLSEGQRVGLRGTFSWQLDTAKLVFSEQLHRIFEFESNTDPTFAMIAERVYPDDVPVLANVHARVRGSPDSQDCEIRLQMPDGRLKWIRVFARVNRHDDGQQECLGAVLDVTQCRLAK